MNKKGQSMKIASSAFENQQKIPLKYTCLEDGINPPLEFSDVPKNAKSLALIMDDPDAPMGTFVHWVVFDIPAVTTGIAENSKPAGTEGKNGAGETGYFGPCPPSGTHRYFFKLYALDSLLGLDTHADKKAIENAMEGHIVAQAELIGVFSK